MRREEVIREACAIVSLAYYSIGDHSEPSDGFCDECVKLHGGEAFFQHSGKSLEYVRNAVLRALREDGIKIDEGFDPITGRSWRDIERDKEG